MCVLRANAQCCLIPKWCKVNGTTLTGIAALLQLWTTLPSIFLTLKHVRMATPTQCQARGQHFVAIATVFENHRKSLIQYCERSELRLHFEWTKVY